MAEFAGFPADGLSLLGELPSHDTESFDALRSRYRAEIAEPAKRFVEALGEELVSDHPNLQAVPKVNGSIAPINNDRRFAPDATPYKDHLMFRFWEGSTKKVAPTLFVRLHPTDGVGFASGITPADVGRWREVIADETGARIADAIDDLVASTGAEVVGRDLARVPTGYSPDHDRADLLRHKALQVRWIEPTPAEVTTADVVPWCHAQLQWAADLHRALVTAFE